MHRTSLALLAVFLPLLAPAACADDDVTSFHYMDLYKIEHSVASLQGLKGLQVVVYVVSTKPRVYPEDITLTLHRASGALETVPHDVYGRVVLPESEALKAENPLIVTNQPKHTLQASVIIALMPPAGDELHYRDLMLGITQLNQAIDGQSLGAMAKLYGHKSTGLLLFYGSGEHSLTVHKIGGDDRVKGGSVDTVVTRLRGVLPSSLGPGMRVIYLPLEPTLLKTNPWVTLDASPEQTLPAF